MRADRRRRHLVDGAETFVSGTETEIFRADRLARNAGFQAIAPRIYSGPVQLWMRPNAHLVAYPISGARQINIVAIVSGTWNRPGWSAPGEANEIKDAFTSSRWPGPARMMIGAVDEWRKWALFTVPDGGDWSEG